MTSRKSRRWQQDDNTAALIVERVVRTNGDIHNRAYTRGKFLGKGGFARCYEVTSQENRKTYAAKVVPKSTLTKSRAKQKLMSEIRIHKSLKHENIVELEHFFEDHENVYILLELCPNQSMNELLRRRKRLTEVEVQVYMLQTVSALKYLHEKKIIHRDMKLGNLFLGEKLEVKVGDLGLATVIEQEGEKRRTICGTPNYIAPEVLDNKLGHSFEVDIWALGVIMYTLLIGKPPFETSEVKATYNKILLCQYTFPEHIKLSDEAVSLITDILKVDPTKRPSLDQILEHDFFHQGYEIPKVLPISMLAVPPSKTYLKQLTGGSPRGATDRLAFSETLPVIGAIQGRDLGNTQKLRQKEGLDDEEQDRGDPNYFDSYLVKFADYSSKYGMGYLLSNGAIGVFFNDASKIILEPQNGKFYYIERNQHKQDVAHAHTLSKFPKSIAKKVTLLQHFKNYLQPEPEPEHYYDPQSHTAKRPPPYIKKWIKTRRATLFRLSNKNIQVKFQDNSEIILSTFTRNVKYTDKQGQKQQLPIAHAMSSHPGIAKRLRYTKEIMNIMLNGPTVRVTEQ